MISTKEEEKNPQKKSCLVKTLEKIDTFLNLAYFFNLFKAMQLKVVLGSMTSIVSIDPWSFSGFVNIVFVFNFRYTLLLVFSYPGCLFCQLEV